MNSHRGLPGVLTLANFYEAVSGSCSHPDLGPTSASADLQSAHEAAFHGWLALSREEQAGDFQAFLAAQPGVRDAWLERDAYGAAVPAAAPKPLRRVFLCHLDILLTIHRHHFGAPASGAWRVTAMLDLAHRENGSVRVSIKRLAEEYRVSENYLGRIFRRRTGMGFREYLRLVRIRCAVELQRLPGSRAGEVAGTLGHSRTENFAREFREAVAATASGFGTRLRR